MALEMAIKNPIEQKTGFKAINDFAFIKELKNLEVKILITKA